MRILQNLESFARSSHISIFLKILNFCIALFYINVYIYYMKPIKLKCEYQENLLGTDIDQPRISWILDGPGDDIYQTAWRILVSTDLVALKQGFGAVWDSKRVESTESYHIEYNGTPLESFRRYWFTVTVWDQTGKESTSEASWWETGALTPEEWKGEWIGQQLSQEMKFADQNSPVGLPCPRLRRTFKLDGPVSQARLYASALGVYELRINGKNVDSGVFHPGWTDYSKRVYYQTFEISSLLMKGENIVEAILGDGWYTGHVWQRGRKLYGDYPLKFTAMLFWENADGTKGKLFSDHEWTAATGPILSSDILMGEVFDATRSWGPEVPVDVFSALPIHLEAQKGPIVRKQGERTAQVVTQPIPGMYIFDFGQNLAGWAQLRTQGPRGTEVKLRFAEMLTPEGLLYTENLRTAAQTDHYILSGEGEEIWEPRFTYHGFRYVEVTGLTETATVSTLIVQVVHSDTPITGTFVCSNPVVNQLFSNILWGQKSNFFSIPTDCPQRDERLGWTGDTTNFLRTGLYNMDCAGFYEKYQIDIIDAQFANGAFSDVAPQVDPFPAGNGGWGDAGILVPWQLYLTYGDRRILETSYDAIKRFVTYLKVHNERGIRPEYVYGDWLHNNAPTPTNLINTAWAAWSITLASQIAKTLDRCEDAKQWATDAEFCKKAFRRKFRRWNGEIAGNTQAAYVLSLAMDLLKPNQEADAVRRLVADLEARNWHQSTGFVSNSFLLPILSKHGRTDVASKLVNNTTYPSWGYSVVNGATTIWERWNSYTKDKGFEDPSMNSFNHYSLGSVGEWFYAYAAGITMDLHSGRGPGIRLAPRLIEGWSFAEASYESVVGKITSRWNRLSTGAEYHFIIPPNTRARVSLECFKGQHLEGLGKIQVKFQKNSVEFELGSGIYNIGIH